MSGKDKRNRRRPGARKPASTRKTRGIREWVGGRLKAPFYVTEPQPYHPELILWLELPDDLVVGSEVIDPNGPAVSFAETLNDAMLSPLVGPPRRPRRIRVSDESLAGELRQTCPDLEVAVAPTPELDWVLEMMAATSSDPDQHETGASYFAGGTISRETIKSLFRAAEALFKVSPWDEVSDLQALRVDIPALDVAGTCISVIGALGESRGLLVFPDLEAFEGFIEAAESADAADGFLRFGAPLLSLNFDRGAELPDSMRREVTEHGWPVAAPNAYPTVLLIDRDGIPHPPSEEQVQFAAICASALAEFITRHPYLLGGADWEPVCESIIDENDLEVRITAPYEAASLFDQFETPMPALYEPIARHVGRNDPCPCGSGKKYKKCCMQKDQAARDTTRAPARVHELDQRLVERMMHFATQRFDDARSLGRDEFRDAEAAVQLWGPWAVYHALIDGKPIVDWFIDAQGHRLSNSERQWLSAQQASWLSVWEVSTVEAGSHVMLKDLLTGEQRTVIEVRGSTTLASRDVILGRVVHYQELSVLGGSHPRTLPPIAAAGVVHRIRGRLRRKHAIPVDRLRDEKVGSYIIKRWEEAVEELDYQRSIPPRLQNTDGEELLFTTEHFEFDPAHRSDVESRLAALEYVQPPAPDEPEQTYVFLRPGNAAHRSWESTVVGRVKVASGKLRLEANSVKRANALRKQFEAACGHLVRHRAREHSDPVAALSDPSRAAPEAPQIPELPLAEANALILEFKQKHYADWIDQPLAPLQGKTPREAGRTKAGRDQVDVLLKHLENAEARMPAEERFDFSLVRRQLGFKM